MTISADNQIDPSNESCTAQEEAQPAPEESAPLSSANSSSLIPEEVPTRTTQMEDFLNAETSHRSNSRGSLTSNTGVSAGVNEEINAAEGTSDANDNEGAAILPTMSSSQASTLTDSYEARKNKRLSTTTLMSNMNTNNLPADTPTPTPGMDDSETTNASLAVSVVQIPSSLPSSLNSSFVTYYDEHTIEDIRNMVLVDDDNDDNTANSARREMSLSPLPTNTRRIRRYQPQPQPPQQQQQIQPQIPNILADDSNDNSLHHGALHERTDFCPVRPMRGTSIGSGDFEELKAALDHQYGNNNYHQSTASGFPSMFEDSLSTFATADNSYTNHNNNNSNSNSHHGTNAVIMEEEDEAVAAQSQTLPSWKTDNNLQTANNNNNSKPNKPSTFFQRRNSLQHNHHHSVVAGVAKTQEQKRHSLHQRRNSLQQSTIPKPPSTIFHPHSPGGGSGSASNRNTIRRTNSRNSQYSAYSNVSSLDASVIKRISRSERINALKRKSIQQNANMNASINTTMAVYSPLASPAASISQNSYQSQGNSKHSNSLSSNSRKPTRRPTFLLPTDALADLEPTSFFEHSESQLSLTSSEEEDEDDNDDSDGDRSDQHHHGDDKDATPRLPGRRDSVSSMSMYEAEAAAMRLNSAFDQPLAAPLRRMSTFGSQTDIYLEHVRRGGEMNSLEQDNSSSYNNNNNSSPPISSIHIAPPTPTTSYADATANTTTSPAVAGATEAAEDHVPKVPARQRSFPRKTIEQHQEWLQNASPATTDDLPIGVLNTFVEVPTATSHEDHEENFSVLAALSDFIPAKPTRQSTFTKDNIPQALAMMRSENVMEGGAGARTNSSNEEKENTSNTSLMMQHDQSNSSNMSISSLNNSNSNHNSGGGGSHHRRTNSADAAPSVPTRQNSKPRPLSPAVFKMATSTLDDAKEMLLLNDDRDKQSQHALAVAKKSSSPLHKTANSAMQAARRSITSVSTNETTVCANNTHGHRMLPGRHFTRGKSLKSAAASLQVQQFFHTDDPPPLVPGEQSKTTTEVETAPLESTSGTTTDDLASSSGKASPMSELERLKQLNEDTMNGIKDQFVDCLQLGEDDKDGDQGKDESNKVDPKTPVASEETKDVQAAPEKAPLPDKSSASALLAQLLGEASNHSDGTACTSASKEFEHLKMMNDDAVADLETQLQLLEQEQQQHVEEEFELSADFSGSSSHLKNVAEATALDGSKSASSVEKTNDVVTEPSCDDEGAVASAAFQEQSTSSIECAI